MRVISRKERYGVFFVFLAVYISLAIYNLVNGSQWFFDNLVAIVFLVFMFLIARWLLLTPGSFIMFNLALTLHNLGTFGLYGTTLDGFFYDNIVHFFGALVAAWIIFNFVSARLHIKWQKDVKRTVVDEHKVVLIFLVFASVAMLGSVVELVEFGGFVFLGPGEGIFFVGSGDGGYNVEDFKMQYYDTMEDMIVNALGSFAGVLMFYRLRYRKGEWVRIGH
ncbi:MAG: DUF2238 domain-containing protein [Nanoarchaeota archaeon]|nr:DUF2238 domain-containing protein [Nanoarchaeota archaeon]